MRSDTVVDQLANLRRQIKLYQRKGVSGSFCRGTWCSWWQTECCLCSNRSLGGCIEPEH